MSKQASVVNFLRRMADMLESGRVEVIDSSCLVDPVHEALMVHTDGKTTWSSLYSVRVEVKQAEPKTQTQ